nr:molybdopterin-binding protein [Leucobacter edaphi]
MLANAGISEVPVVRLPRVLLLATGDEVAGAGETPRPGQIFDANGPLLAAALRGAGAEVVSRRVADQPAAVTALLREEAPRFDLVVTSGGISAGAFEVIREALTPAGIDFLAVAMQPGGPQGLGALPGGTPVLCFPGNPVSSALSAEAFLLPLLRSFAGRTPRRSEHRELADAVDSPAMKHQLRRGNLDTDGRVRVTPPSSHLLADLAAAELIAHIPLGVTRLEAGDTVEIWRLDD